MGFNPLPLNLITLVLLLASMFIFTYVMRDISRRLGEALRVRRYYLLYDTSFILLVLAVVLGLTSYLVDFPLHFYGFDLTLAGTWVLSFIAITIDFLVTVKYWGWLLPELLKSPKK